MPKTPTLDPNSHPDTMMYNAASLQALVRHLEIHCDTGSNEYSISKGSFLAVPILLVLATEIALKAWRCFEGDTSPVKEHDLVNLYNGLSQQTKSAIAANCPVYFLPGDIPIPDPKNPTILRILQYHRDTFVHWRYIHETLTGFAEPPAMDTALTAIIQTYSQKRFTFPNLPMPANLPVLGNRAKSPS